MPIVLRYSDTSSRSFWFLFAKAAEVPEFHGEVAEGFICMGIDWIDKVRNDLKKRGGEPRSHFQIFLNTAK